MTIANETSLRSCTDILLQNSIKRTVNRHKLQPLYKSLKFCQNLLNEPLQVTIVGKINTGKSTLMNGVIGTKIVATGTLEMTRTASCFRWGEEPSLKVHFHDGRQEVQVLEDLESIVDPSKVQEIKYVEIFYPNETLKALNFIDTPGWDSNDQSISEITSDFLRKSDAVLYLVRKSVSALDQSLVEEFIGPTSGQVRPFKSIGVLTRVDEMWRSIPLRSPLEVGEHICNRLVSDYSKLGELFYNIYPVSGQLAFAAKTLETEEFEILTQLARSDENDFMFLVKSEHDFDTKEDEQVLIPPVQRKRVRERLGQYGVVLSYRLIRDGINDQQELTHELMQQSGFPKLWNTVIDYFGRNAFLIKLDNALQQIKDVFFQIRNELVDRYSEDWQILEEIAEDVEKLQADVVHSFDELLILRDYYENKLKFTQQESEQLLAVTGRRGTSCAKRLGLEGDKPLTIEAIEEMLDIARNYVDQWRWRSNDFIRSDRNTIEAARVLTRSYEEIIERLKKAQEYLQAARKYFY